MNDMELVSLPELAKMVGVPYSSAIRYVKNYPEYFMFSYIDGVKMFSRDQSAVLKRIQELHRTGKKTKAVKAVLEAEIPKNVDITNGNEADQLPATPSQADMMALLIGKVESMADAFNRVADQLERQNSILDALPIASISELPGLSPDTPPAEKTKKPKAKPTKKSKGKAKAKAKPAVPDIDDPAKNPNLPGMEQANDADWKTYDEAVVFDLIKQYAQDGMKSPAIAKRFTQERYLTKTGKQSWNQATVYGIMKRLKERGELG